MNNMKRCGAFINGTMSALKVQILGYTGYISKRFRWQSLKAFLN